MTKPFALPCLTPHELGLNDEKVRQLVDYCNEQESDELIIISKNGMLHMNYTNNDQPIALNSLTKVFAGTAIGMLLDDGLLSSLHTPLSTYFTNLRNKAMGEIKCTL